MLTNQQVFDVLQLAIEHDIRPMRMGKSNDSVTYFLGQFLDAVILDRLMPKNPAEHWTNWQRYRKAPSGVKGPLMPRTSTNEKAHVIACYYSDNHGFTVFELSNGRKVSYGKLKPRHLAELFGDPAAVAKKKKVPIYPNNMDSRPAIDSMLRAEYGESKLPLPPD